MQRECLQVCMTFASFSNIFPHQKQQINQKCFCPQNVCGIDCFGLKYSAQFSKLTKQFCLEMIWFDLLNHAAQWHLMDAHSQRHFIFVCKKPLPSCLFISIEAWINIKQIICCFQERGRLELQLSKYRMFK